MEELFVPVTHCWKGQGQKLCEAILDRNSSAQSWSGWMATQQPTSSKSLDSRRSKLFRLELWNMRKGMGKFEQHATERNEEKNGLHFRRAFSHLYPRTMAALYKFATCSACLHPLFDPTTAQDRMWLGSCAHRLCTRCAPSMPSACMACHATLPFKSLSFSNATHVVEILMSSLTELAERVSALERAAPPIHPLPPAPDGNLFTIPLPQSDPPNQPRQAPSAVAQAQQREAQLFASFQHASQPVAAAQRLTSRVNAPNFATEATLEDAWQPKTRQEKLDNLDRFRASPVTNQGYSAYSQPQSKPSFKKPSSIPIPKAQEREASPRQAEKPSPKSVIPFAEPSFSQRNFLADLRAQFDAE